MAERRQHERLTAYCGLYCGDCIRHRSRAADLASELRSELERVKFADYARVKCEAMKELRHYAEACLCWKPS